MNQVALVELMELLKIFEVYTYYRHTNEFYISNMTDNQFVLLYDLILRHNLKFRIDNGVRIWL